MGRINVTIRIFVGTLVPNFQLLLWRLDLAGRAYGGRPYSVQRLATDQAIRRIVEGRRFELRGPLVFVTVLAQDHCYSDLLRSVPTTIFHLALR